MEVDQGWRFVSMVSEGQATDVGGVDPWAADWRPTGSRVTVAHPQYPSQRHTLTIYEMPGAAAPVRFAAGEFSNGAWGFFVPVPDKHRRDDASHADACTLCYDAWQPDILGQYMGLAADHQRNAELCQCPQRGSLYEVFPADRGAPQRLTTQQGRARFPGAL